MANYVAEDSEFNESRHKQSVHVTGTDQWLTFSVSPFQNISPKGAFFVSFLKRCLLRATYFFKASVSECF